MLLQFTLNWHRREKNVIIQGLPVSSVAQDADLFLDLCQNHLKIIAPKVVLSRRLGEVIPGTTQRLLLSFSNSVEADAVLAAAKSLRYSTRADMKSIFINPDLTKAESNVASLERERRRNKRRTQLDNESGAAQTNSSSVLLRASQTPSTTLALGTLIDLDIPTLTCATPFTLIGACQAPFGLSSEAPNMSDANTQLPNCVATLLPCVPTQGQTTADHAAQNPC